MSPEVESGPAYDDHRGRLVPVEFAGLPFVPVRAFVVAATTGTATRGGHLADCRELIVLVAGTVVVTLTAVGRPPVEHDLCLPGDRLLVEPDQVVRYELGDREAVVLVLADRPFGSDAAARAT